MNKQNGLEESVRTSLDQYFSDLGGSEPHDMWKMVMNCVEKPVLEVAMERSNGNQSIAAKILGMTRSTLRKKLLAHNIQ